MGIRKDGYHYKKRVFSKLSSRTKMVSYTKKNMPANGVMDISEYEYEENGKTHYGVVIKSDTAKRKEWLDKYNDREFYRWYKKKARQYKEEAQYEEEEDYI